MPIHFALRTPAGADNSPGVEDEVFLQGREGPVIMLIHGLTGTPYEMSFVARHLHRRGFTVNCPRLANHGAPLAVLKATRWDQCFESMRTAFRKLRERVGVDAPIFVGGLSAGALLALLLADVLGPEIAGVACLSPTLFYDGWNVPWTHRLLPLAYATPLRQFFYFKEEPPYGIKNEGVRRRIDASYGQAKLGDDGDFARNGYPYYPVTLFCEMRKLIRHCVDRLSAITTPVQIQQAVEDDITSPRNSEFIYQRVASPTKELVLIQNSYHVITADQERERVAEHIATFCERVVAESAAREIA
ncbi:MAG: alpha/beta fold hydrolase [Chthoniobacteraceae bacterium]